MTACAVAMAYGELTTPPLMKTTIMLLCTAATACKSPSCRGTLWESVDRRPLAPRAPPLACTPASVITPRSKFSASVVWSLPRKRTLQGGRRRHQRGAERSKKRPSAASPPACSHATSAAAAAAAAAAKPLVFVASPGGQGMLGKPGGTTSQMLQPLAYVTARPRLAAAASGLCESTSVLVPW